MLRKLLDKMHPLFAKGGKLHRLYPLYEAQDTFLYTPGEVTEKNTHVRDSLDSKRMMSMVIVALVPCIFMAMYNTGFQASKILAQAKQADASYQPEGWRYGVLDSVGVDYMDEAYAKDGSFFASLLSPGRLFSCLLHGALFFLPVYIVCMTAGGLSEVLFCIVRGHEVTEGFLVTGMLFPLTLPPTIPLWQVALGIMFGVIVGKEIFGGVGYNFLNPALTARAFLYFAYAGQISGGNVWTAVDGYTGATALGEYPVSGAWELTGTLRNTAGDVVFENTSTDFSWWNAFIGNIHGSMGETSVLACLIGAAILIAVGVGSWRIMLSVLIGVFVFSGLLNLISIFTGLEGVSTLNIRPWEHLLVGGLAFGAVFMATDPVSASMTDTGKWAYGFLIGVMTVVIRSINPAFPEGIMLAILFGNVFAPLIDYFVIQANVKRRLARNEA